MFDFVKSYTSLIVDWNKSLDFSFILIIFSSNLISVNEKWNYFPNSNVPRSHKICQNEVKKKKIHLGWFTFIQIKQKSILDAKSSIVHFRINGKFQIIFLWENIPSRCYKYCVSFPYNMMMMMILVPFLMMVMIIVSHVI